MTEVISPEKLYRAAARGSSSVPASDLIKLNNDRVLLSNYPSSTSHALKATKDADPARSKS